MTAVTAHPPRRCLRIHNVESSIPYIIQLVPAGVDASSSPSTRPERKSLVGSANLTTPTLKHRVCTSRCRNRANMAAQEACPRRPSSTRAQSIRKAGRSKVREHTLVLLLHLLRHESQRAARINRYPTRRTFVYCSRFTGSASYSSKFLVSSALRKCGTIGPCMRR